MVIWNVFDACDTMDVIEGYNHPTNNNEYQLLKQKTRRYIVGDREPHFAVPSTIVHGELSLLDHWLCCIDDQTFCDWSYARAREIASTIK